MRQVLRRLLLGAATHQPRPTIDHLPPTTTHPLQVLLNLLFNAVKFTPQGRIVVTASMQQVSVRVRVRVRVNPNPSQVDLGQAQGGDLLAGPERARLEDGGDGQLAAEGVEVHHEVHDHVALEEGVPPG